MTIRNAANRVPAVTTKNMLKGSSIARSCATACAMASGLRRGASAAVAGLWSETQDHGCLFVPER